MSRRFLSVVFALLVASGLACTSDGSNDEIAACTASGGRWTTASSCRSAYCDTGYVDDPAPRGIAPSALEIDAEVEGESEEETAE